MITPLTPWLLLGGAASASSGGVFAAVTVATEVLLATVDVVALGAAVVLISLLKSVAFMFLVLLELLSKVVVEVVVDAIPFGDVGGDDDLSLFLLMSLVT